MISSGYTQVGRGFRIPASGLQGRIRAGAHRTKSGPGYHGFVVHADPSVTLEEDLERRDLTINAMAIDEAGVVIDPYGGRRFRCQNPAARVATFYRGSAAGIASSRFAARYHHLGFTVARETMSLMAEIVAAMKYLTSPPSVSGWRPKAGRNSTPDILAGAGGL